MFLFSCVHIISVGGRFKVKLLLDVQFYVWVFTQDVERYHQEKSINLTNFLPQAV